MTPPVLTVFPEDSITVVLVVVSTLGGRGGEGRGALFCHLIWEAWS